MTSSKSHVNVNVYVLLSWICVCREVESVRDRNDEGMERE